MNNNRRNNMKKDTYTMSVKDARPEKEDEGERKYTFRTVDIDHIQAYGNIRTGDVEKDDQYNDLLIVARDRE